MSDTVDVDGLEKLARAATPGPWDYEHDKEDDSHIIGVALHDKAYGFSIAEVNSGEFTEEDAAYIAAANPATVLAMVAEIRRLKKRDHEWFTLAARIAHKFKCLPSVFPDAYEHLLSAIYAKSPQWVKCSERMPPDNRIVIVFIDRAECGWYMTSSVRKDDRWDGIGSYQHQPTFWQPLPEKPDAAEGRGA